MIKVEILRKKDGLSDSGWFVTVVQDFNFENEWTKVKYISEEGEMNKVK